MNGTVRIYVHIDCSLFVAPVDVVQIPDSIPIGSEFLGLVRIDPAVIGLVVGICGGHKFHVRAVAVGQSFAVPGVSICHMAPGPELSALVDIVVACQHCACIPAIVIPSHEIVLKVVDED